MSNDRSSEADHPQLVTDPGEIARIEAENTLRQFDDSMSELAKWLAVPSYQFRVSTVLRFNRIALEGVSAYAGTFRPGPIKISGSAHVPPEAAEVPELMEEFCDYIQANWSSRSAIHLSAYALWRLNWIHPFVDGNGRTARSVSYLILCARLGYRLPGRQTIAEQIAADKKPYYQALEKADTTVASPEPSVSDLEELLAGHLARQLLRIHEAATGAMGIDRAAMPSLPAFPNTERLEKRSVGSLEKLVHHIEKHPVICSGVVGIIGITVAVLAIIFQK